MGDPSAESFKQFMDRISAQIDSGAIPAIGHEEVCASLLEASCFTLTSALAC